jgi:hypothetical protein
MGISGEWRTARQEVSARIERITPPRFVQWAASWRRKQHLRRVGAQ